MTSAVNSGRSVRYSHPRRRFSTRVAPDRRAAQGALPCGQRRQNRTDVGCYVEMVEKSQSRLALDCFRRGYAKRSGGELQRVYVLGVFKRIPFSVPSSIRLEPMARSINYRACLVAHQRQSRAPQSSLESLTFEVPLSVKRGTEHSRAQTSKWGHSGERSLSTKTRLATLPDQSRQQPALNETPTRWLTKPSTTRHVLPVQSYFDKIVPIATPSKAAPMLLLVTTFFLVVFWPELRRTCGW